MRVVRRNKCVVVTLGRAERVLWQESVADARDVDEVRRRVRARGRAAAQRWGFRQVEVYAPAEGRGCTLDVFTVDLEGDA